MLNLVFKDLLIQKKTIAFSIVYGLIFTLLFAKTDTPEIIFIAVPSVIAYLFVSSACAYDDKSKSDIMLNSLPISRKDIVISKYLSILVYLIIGICISTVFISLIKITGYKSMRMVRLEDLIGVCASVGVLCSIYFPIYFKFGYMKTRYFNSFMTVSAFFIPGAISSLLRQHNTETLRNIVNYLNSLPNSLLGCFIVGIILIIIIFSYAVSSKVYLSKDL